jgi:hypothetical protein
VSTILRALRKLEQENANQPPGSGISQAFNARQAVYRSVRFAWRKGQLIRWGLVLLALSVGAAVIIRFIPSDGTLLQKHLTDPLPSLRQSDQKAAVAASSPEISATFDNWDSETIHTFLEGEMNPDNEPGMHAIASTTSILAGSESPIPTIAAPGPAGTSPQTTTQSGPAAKVVTSGKENNAPVKPSARINRSEIPMDAERLQDGRLKIQAIAWAPDARERMAVINNRILREGESVEGFTVLMIGEDQVLLSAEGRRWRVVFGRR